MKRGHSSNKRKNLLALDYSIPRFSFKQAFLLIITLFVLFSISLFVIENIAKVYILPTIIVTSILIGYSIPTIQYYKKEKKRKKNIIGALFSLLAFIMLFSLYFTNTLL